MESPGAELSLLGDDEAYAVVHFQIKVLSKNTFNSVYFGSPDFFDRDAQEFWDFYSYDFYINPESIKLGIGKTEEIILFAVLPQKAGLEALYYTHDSFICFAPEREI